MDCVCMKSRMSFQYFNSNNYNKEIRWWTMKCIRTITLEEKVNVLDKESIITSPRIREFSFSFPLIQ